jgi:allantoinase
VVTAEGVRPATIHIADGKISAVADWDSVPIGTQLDEFDDDVLFPGVVDTHVHVNEPGRTEWEGFASATDAAAAGGTTALVDMPLNSIPATTTLAALERKREAARGQLRVDVGFWGGVVPGNRGELASMAAAGALGFKCFLIESGVDEFQFITEPDLRPAMEELARVDRPLLVHAEVAGPIDEARARIEREHLDPRLYSTYLASRPRAAEDRAIEMLIGLVRRTHARAHIVHHSSSDALPMIRDARREGLPLTAETCPHYLSFTAEEIPDGRTEFKCAPPIREGDNREALWAALGAGLLDLVASDHSPCSPGLKKLEQGDFDQAWGGISGLQMLLPATWTEASARGHGLLQLARWLCEGPSRLAGLWGRKGALQAGFDADVIVFRPEEELTVEANKLLHKHKVTPYAGRRLRGTVRATFARGVLVYHRGELMGAPRGQLLTK